MWGLMVFIVVCIFQMKTLETVPYETLQDPRIDEQLTILAAAMKRLTKLSGG